MRQLISFWGELLDAEESIYNSHFVLKAVFDQDEEKIFDIPYVTFLSLGHKLRKACERLKPPFSGDGRLRATRPQRKRGQVQSRG